MQVHESGEMYLETILILSQSSGFVRAVDVGEYLGYSKPSVSRALGILKSGGFITVDRDGAIHMTDSGRAIGEKIYERHTYLSQLFMKLGVSQEVAVADACKMEHCISDETFQALKRHVMEHQDS